MLKSTGYFFTVILLVSLAGTGHAQLNHTIEIDQNMAVDLLIKEELERRELEGLLAPIKSQEDLNDYLERHNISDTPLGHLSPEGLKKFVSSLIFTDKGLASFHYPALIEELTATGVYEVLSLFGLQSSAGSLSGLRAESRADEIIVMTELDDGFLEGYRCESAGTCVRSWNHACTSNC